MEGFFDSDRKIFRSLNQKAVFHYRSGNTDHIALLEGIITNQVRLYLAG